MVFEESVVLDLPFDEALVRTKEAFAAQVFGVLTEIDVQATLKAKIDKDMGRYVIVGACNPGLAGRALDAEPLIGVLLPCNVVVRETDRGVEVDAMDPGVMASLTGKEAVKPVADEARRLVSDALDALMAQA
jgi:uncharacterized protein (DUF302 family)